MINYDLSEIDLVSETVEDLSTAGEAFRDHGYIVDRYTVSNNYLGNLGVISDDPEDAMNQYLRKLGEQRYMKAEFPAEALLNLFTEGSEQHMENALNTLLHQIRGRVHPKEPEMEDPGHPINLTMVDYFPEVGGGIYMLDSYDARERYVDEFYDILDDAGLRVELTEPLKH